MPAEPARTVCGLGCQVSAVFLTNGDMKSEETQPSAHAFLKKVETEANRDSVLFILKVFLSKPHLVDVIPGY